MKKDINSISLFFVMVSSNNYLLHNLNFVIDDSQFSPSFFLFCVKIKRSNLQIYKI